MKRFGQSSAVIVDCMFSWVGVVPPITTRALTPPPPSLYCSQVFGTKTVLSGKLRLWSPSGGCVSAVGVLCNKVVILVFRVLKLPSQFYSPGGGGLNSSSSGSDIALHSWGVRSCCRLLAFITALSWVFLTRLRTESVYLCHKDLFLSFWGSAMSHETPPPAEVSWFLISKCFYKIDFVYFYSIFCGSRFFSPFFF